MKLGCKNQGQRAAAPCVGEQVGRGVGVVEVGVGEDRGKALLLCVSGRELADAVAVEVVGDVLPVVLRIDLPERLQVLPSHHLQAAIAPWMTREVRDVEHAAHEGDNDAALHASGVSAARRGRKAGAMSTCWLTSWSISCRDMMRCQQPRPPGTLQSQPLVFVKKLKPCLFPSSLPSSRPWEAG